MADKNKIRFTINGKTYTLLHDEPEEYMRRIEHYLNTRVAAASKSGIQLGEQTAIVMASISITDELFKTQKNFNTLKNEIKRMMDEYDRLKIEKQELDEQLTTAIQQIDKLSKQLLLARHGAYEASPVQAVQTTQAVEAVSATQAGQTPQTVEAAQAVRTAQEQPAASEFNITTSEYTASSADGSVTGNIFFPANHNIDDED